MATNRTNIKLSRTLLIILGILLACILMLNAKSFQSADLLSEPTNLFSADSKSSKTLIDKIGTTSFKEFAKKISSLN